MRKVDEIKADLEKAKKQLETAKKMNAPQAAIDTANGKISKLEKELEEAEKAPPVDEKKDEKKDEPKAKAKPTVKKKKEKPAPAKKEKGKRGRKKHTKEQKAEKRREKAAKKVEKTVTINGKTYTEKDKEFCDKLLQKWHGRKLAMKKAGKKFKTKSISSKVAGDVADAVLKTFKFVETEQRDKIVKNPSIYVTKFERADAKATQFVNSLKDLLGEDYKSTQVKKELDEIEKAIKAFVAKFKKLKK